MKKLISIFLICITGLLSAQDMPRTVTNRHTLANWVRDGSFTFTNKTLTSPTITGASLSGTTAFTGIVTITTTNALTSGTYRSLNISQTQTGDGAAVLEALRVNIASAVQTGSWANAIVGRIAYSGATGDAGGGMAAAICAEVVLPAITGPAGQYFAADLEFDAQEGYTANAGTSYPTAYIRYGLFGNATAIASFEDDAYFMHVSTDFTDASGNMWYDNTLRIQIETTDWFIPLSDAEGEYSSAYLIDISNTTDATGTTDGSIQTDGGMGVAKKLFVGTDLAVDGTSNLDDVDIDGTLNVDGALTLESSRTGGANTKNSYKITLTAGETFTGTTGHQFKIYDADNTVVHDGGEHCGVYVNMKQLSAMTNGGKSVLFSGHNYGSGGDYQIIDAGVWLYGNLVDAFKISGGSIDTGLDLSETTVTAQDVHLSSGARIFTGTAANGDAVYAEVGSRDATGSLYISTAAGALYVQVANAGAAADWYKVTSTDAD